MRVLSAAALAALALVACGGAGPAPARPPAAPSAGSGLGDADAGRTVAMRAGEEVTVSLHQQPGFGPWQNLQSSNSAVLQSIVEPRATAARGVTLGRFRAVAPGQAQISATAVPDCSPGVACAAIARAWMVTVVVAA